ncbi:hypothetical protein M408DRAFT_70065 [Serendipita vermifera MAFF 305830]|uniref:F-box domain-containing protein n=1 Tax=Serendipita vermifera MAFF 305830 TaxID=933852 RepID=A0A0C2WPT7_SERVB|nr:hypothetical protein M408DRAFT_70065 [Serendipita vermifera MAFF 305830]
MATGLISNLPNEILSIVFRYATLDDFSTETTYDDPCVLATYRFTEYERSQEAVKTKSSISKVCKHWNDVNSRFLCEYVYLTNARRREVLDGLARCLGRLESGIRGTARGRWTKRVDICLGTFGEDWHTQYSDEDGAELYGWQDVLSLTPNVSIVSLFEGPRDCPCDWSTEVFFSLSKLSSLRRVEWDGTMSDMADLQQLSVLCQSLTHVAFTLTASRSGDSDASTDAFKIHFPQVQTLMLKWDQTEDPTTFYPPFQPWQLPNLKHLTYYLREVPSFYLARNLIQGVGDHLRSLELPVLGRNNMVFLPQEFFTLVPVLEVLILDVFKTSLPSPGLATHSCLRLLGLRLRMGCSLYDIGLLEALHETFRLSAFPALEKARIVHPLNFMDYAHYMTDPLLTCWTSMTEDEEWIPIVTFDDSPVPISAIRRTSVSLDL